VLCYALYVSPHSAAVSITASNTAQTAAVRQPNIHGKRLVSGCVVISCQSANSRSVLQPDADPHRPMTDCVSAAALINASPCRVGVKLSVVRVAATTGDTPPSRRDPPIGTIRCHKTETAYHCMCILIYSSIFATKVAESQITIIMQYTIATAQ